jgi:outer membrane protein OmpA-like peptidoglycan-associated protein
MRISGPIALMSIVLAGCASGPTSQLVDARLAYQQASSGYAATYAPASLFEAQRALRTAELAYDAQRDREWQRQTAIFARRQAELAILRGNAAAGRTAYDRSQREWTAYYERQAAAARAARQRTEWELRQREQQLRAEQLARAESDAQAAADAAQLAIERETREKLEGERDKAIATLRALAAIEETERGLVITLGGSLLFRTDEAVLLPLAEQRLDQIAIALRQLAGDQSLVVEGHTDSVGTESFNRRLSESRADAVRAYLVLRGVPPEQIVAVAKGEDEPVASNATAEGRANNRRVEIVIARPRVPAAAVAPVP